ncbi:hypothetical protein BH10PSE17_BH10PSE17_17590 [soil metagenome]
MLEGLFRRPPEDESIPVLTEIIVPTEFQLPPGAETEPVGEPVPLHQAIADAAQAAAAVNARASSVQSIVTPASAGPLTVDAQPVGTATIPGVGGLLPTQRLAILADKDIVQFEEQLRESVLTRLHPRIDPILHQRLDAAIREVIDAELPQLRERIASALTQTLNDVVARAISKELAKIHASRNANNK